MLRKVATVTLGAMALVASRPAAAYNWSTHSNIVGTAVDVMQTLPPNAATSPPAGVSLTDWQQFLTLVSGSPGKLSLLRTGLPSRLPTKDQPFVPPAGAPATEAYPFNGDTKNCVFRPQDNLDQAGQFRISEFWYTPQRTANPCGLQFSNPTVALQKVLGWHAAGVDDHIDDSVLWFRPTNALGWGLLKEAASRAFEIAAGAILLPFVCLGNAIFGDGCDLNESFDLAREYNPVDYIESWIPGFGYLRSDTYTGLWHFMHVDSISNRFNDPRGMFYEGAGPSWPGFLDVSIMAGADISGLSLNANASRGDDQYGEYDRVGRGDGAWQAHTIGHLEFSAVDNLARYGWDQYAGSGFTSARGLGWPLHAIGDVAEPHHVVGTTSWGHRPYEDFVSEHEEELIVPGDQAQRLRLLQGAFQWWRLFNTSGIQTFVTELARATRNAVSAEDDWPYQDGYSFDYHVSAAGPARAIGSYQSDAGRIAAVLERGISATLGFLVAAGERAQDPGHASTTVCPAGTHFEPTRGCVTGPPSNPQPPASVGGLCPTVPGPNCPLIFPDAGAPADGGSCTKPCVDNGDCGSFERCSVNCCVGEPH